MTKADVFQKLPLLGARYQHAPIYLDVESRNHSTIHQRFFHDLLPRSMYSRLAALEKGGFIASKRTDDGGLHYWELSNRGFKLARARLPELKNEFYRSQAPSHDLIVAAVQLGNWVASWPSHAKVLTERQVTQYHPDLLPAWFSEFGRNPDGFWRIERKDRTPIVIALEVEQSQQSRTHYHDLAHRYGVARWIDRVVWVASTETHANSLNRFFSEVSQYREEKIHNILILSEVMKLGWRARFKHGSETGKTISDLLGDEAGIKPVESGSEGDRLQAWASLIDGENAQPIHTYSDRLEEHDQNDRTLFSYGILFILEVLPLSALLSSVFLTRRRVSLASLLCITTALASLAGCASDGVAIDQMTPRSQQKARALPER